MKISLVNPTTTQIKQAKIGFSWTTLFFGFWPALFRGDWLWFIVMLVAEFLLGFKTYAAGSLVVCLIFAFIYNKLYINGLLHNGWVAANSASNQALISHGFIAPNQKFKAANDDSTPISRRQARQHNSYFGSIILAIVAVICVVLFIYLSFGSMIENNFINLFNPTRVQKKIQNKINSPSNGQTDNLDSNQTPNPTDKSNNSPSPASPTNSQTDDANNSLSNVTNKVKDQVNSITNKTKPDNVPQQNNNNNNSQPAPSNNDNNPQPQSNNSQPTPTNNN